MKKNIGIISVLVVLIMLLIAIVIGDCIMIMKPERFERIKIVLGISDGDDEVYETEKVAETEETVETEEVTDVPVVVETDIPETEAPAVVETDIPETEAPVIVETDIPETEAPVIVETDIPEAEVPVVVETDAPETEAPVIVETDAPETEKAPSSAVYSGQVPWSSPKDDSWFDDALFIGDSRTMGFCNFMGIDGCAAQVSLGASNALTSACMPVTVDGELKYCTILNYLAGRWDNYTKVYVWFGVNDHATPASSFQISYSNFITALKARVNEGTQIYVISILPVNDAKAAEHKYRVTNSELVKLNDAIADMCAEDGINFVNAAQSLTDDEHGFTLTYEESNDGIHLNGSTCRTVKSYILCHTN